MTLIKTPIKKKKFYLIKFLNDEVHLAGTEDMIEAIQLETELHPKWHIIQVEEIIKRKGIQIRIETNRDKNFKEYELSYIIRTDGKPVSGGVCHPKEIIKKIEQYIQ